MFIQKVIVEGFLNFKELSTIHLSTGLNCIFGGAQSESSNLLHAIRLVFSDKFRNLSNKERLSYNSGDDVLKADVSVTIVLGDKSNDSKEMSLWSDINPDMAEIEFIEQLGTNGSSSIVPPYFVQQEDISSFIWMTDSERFKKLIQMSKVHELEKKRLQMSESLENNRKKRKYMDEAVKVVLQQLKELEKEVMRTSYNDEIAALHKIITEKELEKAELDIRRAVELLLNDYRSLATQKEVLERASMLFEHERQQTYSTIKAKEISFCKDIKEKYDEALDTENKDQSINSYILEERNNIMIKLKTYSKRLFKLMNDRAAGSQDALERIFQSYTVLIEQEISELDNELAAENKIVQNKKTIQELQRKEREYWELEDELISKIRQSKQQLKEAKRSLYSEEFRVEIMRVKDRISRGEIAGVIGPLIELFTCSEIYYDAVEVTAGYRLFDFVYDPGKISEEALETLKKDYGIALRPLLTETVLQASSSSSSSSDAIPLLQHLKYKTIHAGVISQVFGKTMICTDISIAKGLVAKDNSVVAITLKGNQQGESQPHRRKTKLRLWRIIEDQLKEIADAKKKLIDLRSKLDSTGNELVKAFNKQQIYNANVELKGEARKDKVYLKEFVDMLVKTHEKNKHDEHLESDLKRLEKEATEWVEKRKENCLPAADGTRTDETEKEPSDSFATQQINKDQESEQRKSDLSDSMIQTKAGYLKQLNEENRKFEVLFQKYSNAVANLKSLLIDKKDLHEKAKELSLKDQPSSASSYSKSYKSMSIHCLRALLELFEKCEVRSNTFYLQEKFKSELDQLEHRIKKVDDYDKAINKQISDVCKWMDNSVDHTFKLLAIKFETVFRKLVPNGTGRLAMVQKDGVQLNAAESKYSGLQVKVAYNGESEKILKDLTLEEKTVVAVALVLSIMMLDTNTVYLLDRLEDTLDPQYHEAFADLVATFAQERSQVIVTTISKKLLQHSGIIYGVETKEQYSHIRKLTNESVLPFINSNA